MIFRFDKVIITLLFDLVGGAVLALVRGVLFATSIATEIDGFLAKEHIMAELCDKP